MVSFLENFPPIIQALWGTGFTYLMTALGALGVFLGRELDKRLLNGMMGFAAGVMIAASYFSLLAPSIELSADLPGPIWLPAVGGFLIGGGFLWAVDKLLPHLHIGDDQPEGLRTTWQRNILLVFAITLHNIPEGLAVGVAFGAANAGLSGASCLLYTSDAADDLLCVDLGGRRIIKKKTQTKAQSSTNAPRSTRKSNTIINTSLT